MVTHQDVEIHVQKYLSQLVNGKKLKTIRLPMNSQMVK